MSLEGIEGIVPREIGEGPDAIRATAAAVDQSVRDVAADLRARGVRRVWVIGNGTSYHSSLVAAGIAQRLAGPDDPVVIASTAGGIPDVHARARAG